MDEEKIAIEGNAVPTTDLGGAHDKSPPASILPSPPQEEEKLSTFRLSVIALSVTWYWFSAVR